MSNIGERIFRIKSYYFGDERGSNKKFADSVGEKPNTVSNWFGRKDGIGDAVIDKILSTFPNIDKGWLVGGNGNMLTQEEAQTSSAATTKKNGYITYLLPMSAMGGSLTGFAVPGTTLKDCEAIISPIEDIDFAITVYGESMAPEYPSGSRILIKKINPDIFIDWGKVYVLDTPNGVVVKEIHKSSKEGYISCHSINPDPKFKPFDVLMDEVFGMYRVLMCLSAK